MESMISSVMWKSMPCDLHSFMSRVYELCVDSVSLKQSDTSSLMVCSVAIVISYCSCKGLQGLRTNRIVHTCLQSSRMFLASLGIAS